MVSLNFNNLSFSLFLLFSYSILYHPFPSVLFICFPIFTCKRGKGSPYSIAKFRVPELIPVHGSQPAGNVSHKPGGRLPLLSARPAVTLATLKRTATFCCLVNRGTMGVNSLPKTERRGCNLNPGPSAPESSMLTTQLQSLRLTVCVCVCAGSSV